jgi:Fe-S oxidoreductase
MTEETDVVILDDHLWQELIELTHGEAAPCFQCGVCTAICPWGDVREEGFNVRSILRAAQLGNLHDLESLWLCTGCLQCEASCPRGVPISKVLHSLRYLLWKHRTNLHSLPTTLWSCYWNNNPLGQPPSARMDWAADLNLQAFDPEQHEWLTYFGCTISYDRRAQEIARATVKILQSANIPFGVLGVEEPCSGEAVLRLGHLPFFEELAQQAIDLFTQRGVEKLIALSPHSFDVFRQHYPALGAKFDVKHITQFLADLIEANALQFAAGEEVQAVFHDPCLLGRGNGEYDAPRQILHAIPGIELLTMDQEKEEGLCCGGGGGRMYLETPPGERFGDLRVNQARETGAALLATACPLCISCLEDSMKVTEGERLPVRDVVEIAADHLESR